MNKKIKVLHIITSLPIGGAQDNTLYTVELLDKKKYEVSLACNLVGEFVDRAKSIDDCKIFHINNLVREINIFKDLIATFELIKLIRKEKFDIVHTHSSKPSIVGRIAAFIMRVPIIIHTIHGFPFHDFMGRLKRLFFIYLEKAMNLITTHLITVSKLNLEKIIILKLANKNKITNIYSGIDFKKFSNQKDNSIKAELNIFPNEKLIGFIGRLAPQKDPFNFLKAIQIIIKSNNSSHFILVGDGPMKEEIEEYLTSNNMKSRVTLLGSRTDIPVILQNLDLFVLSSIYEGLGRSLTEALYCEVPVVATNVEGVPELVKNNKTGLLVEPQNPKSLAEAILFSLENNESIKAYSYEGKKNVVNNFSVQKMVEDIENVYQKLL